MPRKYGLTKKQLIDQIDTEFENALNKPGDSIDQQTADAWKRFNRKPIGGEVEGDSQAVTSDVRETVMGMLPQFMRTIALADNLASFDPVGAEDEELAYQETEALNHVFWKKVPEAWTKVLGWTFSGLMERNAYAEAWWDEKKVVREQEYRNVTLEKFEEMAAQEGWEAVERSEIRQQALPLPTPQGPRQEVLIDVFDVTFRIVETLGFPNWTPFPRSEFRISRDANSLSTSSARMRARERLMPRSELIQMGFQKSQVSKLNAHDRSKEVSGISRTGNDKKQTSVEKNRAASGTNDASQEEILVRRVFMEVDYDGDGIAELREIWMGGDQILRWEEDGKDANSIVSRDPFHVLCAEPRPGEHFGSSPGVESVMDQDHSTMILRQTFNNLTQTNEPKHALADWVVNENTINDLTEPGQNIVRFGDDPNKGHKTLAVPFMARDSFQMLQYLDDKRAARTGVAATGEALEPEDLKHIQQSVHASAMDVSTAKVEMVARTFVETGFKSLLLHMHEMIIENGMRPMKVRLLGKWQEVDPRAWRVREDMTIQVGLGIGSREQQMALIERLAGVQAQMMADPGLRNLVITPQHVYQTGRKMARLARQDPDMFFQDPGQEMAGPTSEQEQEMQLQAQQLQQAQQQVQQEAQRVERDRVKLDKQMAKFEAQVALFNEQLKGVQKQRRLEEQLAETSTRLRAKEIDDFFRQQEFDLKKAKDPAEQEEIRSRTAFNVAQAVHAMANARSTDVETDAAESGLMQIADSVGREEPEESDED